MWITQKLSRAAQSVATFARKVGFKKIAVAALLIAAVCTASVFAAYLAAGSRKGVAVASGYYFTSNVLTSVPSDGTPNGYSLAYQGTETYLSIQIRNYNNQRQTNPLDITYQLEFGLESVASDEFSYYLEYTLEDQTVEVPITESMVTVDGFTLSSDGTNANGIRLLIRTTNGEPTIEDASVVIIKATPTDPKVMSNLSIGSRITLGTGNDEFSVSGLWDTRITETNADIDDMAAFKYEIVTSGVVNDGGNPQIELIWDADMLQFDPYSSYLSNTSIDKDTNGAHEGHLVMEVQPGQSYPIAFYRTDMWTATDDDGLSVVGPVSIDMLRGYVNAPVILAE